MTVNTVSTSFTLTKDILGALQKEADKRTCSKSAVVRMALIKLFKEELDSKDATYGVLHKVSHPFGGIVNESYKKTEDRVASYFSGEF